MSVLMGPGCSCCGNYNFDFCVKFSVALNAFFLGSHIKCLMVKMERESVLKIKVPLGRKQVSVKRVIFLESCDVWENEGL